MPFKKDRYVSFAVALKSLERRKENPQFSFCANHALNISQLTTNLTKLTSKNFSSAILKEPPFVNFPLKPTLNLQPFSNIYSLL